MPPLPVPAPTAVRAFLLSTLMWFAATAQAQASELPVCPAEVEAVQAEFPDVVRQGKGYRAEISRESGAVSNVTLEVVVWGTPDSETQSTTETLNFEDNSSIELVRAVPETGDELDLSVTWDQGIGTPAACTGRKSSLGIPIVAPGTKVGVAGAGRFEGRYRVSTRGSNARPIWRAKPLCDLFACSATVRSNRGLRGKFSFTSDGRGEYILEERFRDGYCDVQYSDGRRAKWTVFRYWTITLRPTKIENGIATELRGSERWVREAPSDLDGGCVPPNSSVKRVIATRL